MVWFPQETRVGAEFTVDLCLRTDFSQAAEADAFGGNRQLCGGVRAVKAGNGNSFRLLEHVVYRIARRLLDDFPNVMEVTIGLYKQNPPMGADCRRVGVEARYARN